MGLLLSLSWFVTVCLIYLVLFPSPFPFAGSGAFSADLASRHHHRQQQPSCSGLNRGGSRSSSSRSSSPQERGWGGPEVFTSCVAECFMHGCCLGLVPKFRWRGVFG